LPEEIPGILNIYADREPIASCPVNPYAAKCIHTSRLDQFSKGWAELRIPVVQQVAAASSIDTLVTEQRSASLSAQSI
jgi:hypothetical protein